MADAGMKKGENQAEAQGDQSMGLQRSQWKITEKDGQLTVCAELPGINKEDVKVELTPEGLTITGGSKREKKERQGLFYRSGRSYGAFSHTIPLPEFAQVDNAKATFENGVLTVSVPVHEPERRRREIPIEAREEGSEPQSTAA